MSLAPSLDGRFLLCRQDVSSFRRLFLAGLDLGLLAVGQLQLSQDLQRDPELLIRAERPDNALDLALLLRGEPAMISLLAACRAERTAFGAALRRPSASPVFCASVVALTAFPCDASISACGSADSLNGPVNTSTGMKARATCPRTWPRAGCADAGIDTAKENAIPSRDLQIDFLMDSSLNASSLGQPYY